LREIQEHKKKMIKEITSFDKSKMFEPKPKNKTSFFKKILTVLGYGKKG
jgi:hypothetical protein